MDELERLNADREAILRWGGTVPTVLDERIQSIKRKQALEKVLHDIEPLFPRKLDALNSFDSVTLVTTYHCGKLQRLGIDLYDESMDNCTLTIDIESATMQAREDDTEYSYDGTDSECEDESDGSNTRAKSIPFAVNFPKADKTFGSKVAVTTFIDALRFMGLARVSAYDAELFKGYKLVSKDQRVTPDGKTWQKPVDGWWVYTNLSNDRKIKCLRAVAEMLNVEMVITYLDQ